MIFDFILWLIFGPAPREVADPTCYLCRGKGQYGGMRALPGDPGSGVAPVNCACVTYEAVAENRPWVKKRLRRQQQQAERQAQQEAYLASIPQTLYAEPQQPAQPDPVAAQRQWDDLRARGEVTLCCNWYECSCGQNVRWVNGQPLRIAGVTLPGSEYDRWKQSTSGVYSLMDARMARQERENAEAPTVQLPTIPEVPPGWS